MDEEDAKRAVSEAVELLSFVAKEAELPAQNEMTTGSIALESSAYYDEGYTERRWALERGVWAPSWWMHRSDYDWGSVEMSVSHGYDSFVTFKLAPPQLPSGSPYTVCVFPFDLHVILEADHLLLPTSKPRELYSSSFRRTKRMAGRAWSSNRGERIGGSALA